MISAIIFSLIGFILAGFLCYLIVPFVIKSALKARMTTVDAHKINKPEIAEPGGLALLLSFLFAFSVIVSVIVAIEEIISSPDLSPDIIKMISFLDPRFGFDDRNLADLLGGLLAIVIAGLIGFIDDIFGIALELRHKILFGFLPALPLVILKVGNPTVDIPILGHLNLPLIYPFLIIPIATNFAFNSYNMLAGYNGLETGMGIISFLTILIISLWVSDTSILLISATMLGALLVFYYFNKNPAKILIGDVGTLMIGTALIVVMVLGNIERLAIGIFLLYFINFILFFVYRSSGQTKKLADIEKIDGKVILKPPCPYTIYWILPFYRKTTEKENVFFLMSLQSIICLFTLIWFILSTA